MRLNARRAAVGAAALLCGLFALAGIIGAADLSPDAAQGLIAQDAKHVLKALNEGKPDKRAVIQIKSSAMMLAAYAQKEITGKNAAQDAKYAALRQNALKVAEAVTAKKFKDAVAPAKALDGAGSAAAKADTKPLKLYELYKFDVNELMAQYKKTAVGGLNVEQDIKDYSKKGGAKSQPAALIAGRVLITIDYLDNMEPDGGFSGGKKTKAAWDEFNKKTRTAAEELAEAAQAPKADAKKLQAAFTKLDAACVACHDVFK